MKKFLIACTTLIMALSCFSFAACDKTEGPGPEEGNNGNNGNYEPVVDGLYVYDGVATFAPYTVYNEDDSETGETFDSMYLAIRYAGEKATSKNKMYVKDKEGLLIFQRQSLSKCWCYDGTCFVGSKPQKEATEWAKQHPRSYVVNGQGTAYVYLGSEDFNLPRHPDDVYELMSGAFSYIFSSSGTVGEGDKWKDYGYSYASATVRLSEAELSESESSQWNAYVFFNIRGSDNCDLGIGSYAGAHRQWKITCNCSNKDHRDGTQPLGLNGFYVYQDQMVTKMTKGEDGVYRGADDIFIETWGGEGFWKLNVTNLRTGQTYGYTHNHEGMHATELAKGGFRVVVAASYCPVMGSVWDARAGGYLKNVLWENVKIARYRADAAPTKNTYTDEDKEELFLGLDTVQYCFTQAADCAHLKFGTHAEAGTYKSGAAYAAGSKYIAFSSIYDGTHLVDED